MIKLLIFLIILFGGIGLGVSFLTEKLPDNNTFAEGKVPDPMLHGDYNGVAFITGPWKGKSFDSGKGTGINLMRENGKVVKKYAFKISIGKGLKNSEKDVVILDYNVPDNPFWLRVIRDELVQTGENEFVGKMYINLVPSYPFTVMYFRLER